MDDRRNSSTDVEWRGDGTCVNRHVYENGSERNLTGDVCKWKYIPIAEHEFEIDWQSKMLGSDYPKQLFFKITSPTRIHNTQLNYDAFRIICPADELTFLRRELLTLQKRAAGAPGNLSHQMDLANGFDKMGEELERQGEPANALTEYGNELDLWQGLAKRDPGNPNWQRGIAQAFERLGTLETQSGHRAEAAEAFRKTTRLLQNLTDTHHSSIQIRVDLLRNLFRLSQVSDAAEAKDALRKSLAIAIELERDHELPDELTGLVAFLKAELAKLH